MHRAVWIMIIIDIDCETCVGKNVVIQYLRKVLLSGLHLNGHTLFSSTDLKARTPFVELNKQYRRKVLMMLFGFHFNGHTLEFHPQTQKRRTTLCSIQL